MNTPPKQSVLGIDVSVVDYATAVSCIVDAALQERPLNVTALAVHGVMTGVLDAEHAYRLNQFDLVCPDGQPVRWGLNWLHHAQLSDRVYGPELMLRTCAACEAAGLPIFLFGGSSEMVNTLKERLLAKYPKLSIAGARASQFRALTVEEQDELARDIRASGAKVAFIGLGCPRQEIFAYEMRDRVGMPMLTIGAAFAFHAGMLAQAPPWMQRAGLEWLYRFTREPRRLWRRYVFLNPMYVSLLILQKLRLWSPSRVAMHAPRREFRFG